MIGSAAEGANSTATEHEIHSNQNTNSSPDDKSLESELACGAVIKQAGLAKESSFTTLLHDSIRSPTAANYIPYNQKNSLEKDILFNHILRNPNPSSASIKYRIQRINAKLLLESRISSGTAKLMAASENSLIEPIQSRRSSITSSTSNTSILNKLNRSSIVTSNSNASTISPLKLLKSRKSSILLLSPAKSIQPMMILEQFKNQSSEKEELLKCAIQSMNKIKAGTDELIGATTKFKHDQKNRPNHLLDLFRKLSDEKDCTLLEVDEASTVTNYSSATETLTVSTVNVIRTRKYNGLLNLKLMLNQGYLKLDQYFIVNIDGKERYQSLSSSKNLDHYVDIPLHNESEVEICIMSDGKLLAFQWFALQHLDDFLNCQYDVRPRTLNAFNDININLEPVGHFKLKANIQTNLKRDLVRKDPVKKIFPRNGHLFLAKDFLQTLKCAVCNEYLGKQGYQCDGCSYTIHPRCYNRVITKCIPRDQMTLVLAV